MGISNQGQGMTMAVTAQPEGEAEGPDSTLVSRNIRIHDRRTSVRLEPEMWDALREVALLQGVSIHDLCGAIHDMKKPEAPFTGAIRVFLLEFYRAAARTHQQVGLVQQRLDEGRKKRG
jgi:predicted DNA-binding ribbon-helix-helix protein